MNMRKIFCVLLLAAVLIGCGKQPEPRHIVILIDVSGSIDRTALDQAFKAIDGLVGHLHRGDWIAIIPILGDAQAEASGRIIRFAVPTNRQAYDADLSNFRRRLGVSLKEMHAEAVAHPGSKTDILGSVALAGQDFRAGQSEPKRLLVILSDFIQEDREINFRSDSHLASHATAELFATDIAKGASLSLTNVSIYLGLLRSEEYADLSQSRRRAIQQFWIAYFEYFHTHATFAMDGPGLLSGYSSNLSILTAPKSTTSRADKLNEPMAINGRLPHPAEP